MYLSIYLFIHLSIYPALQVPASQVLQVGLGTYITYLSICLASYLSIFISIIPGKKSASWQLVAVVKWQKTFLANFSACAIANRWWCAGWFYYATFPCADVITLIFMVIIWFFCHFIKDWKYL